MKIILAVLVACALAANVETSYTMGLPWMEADYADIDYKDEGQLDIGFLFTTDHLVDYTAWTTDENGGWEKNLDSFYDDEMTNLYLQFEIYHNNAINDDTTNAPASAWSDEANAVRCLVCMNVDENSELRAGDKGFAACYRPFTGSFFSDYEKVLNLGTATVTLNYDAPEWVFLGEVKAVNKGEAVKATGKNGWLEDFTWNKHKDDLDTLCTA
jgi:hypothetical protein